MDDAVSWVKFPAATDKPTTDWTWPTQATVLAQEIGHNLGRHWRIGPQQTLYVPAPWLRRGTNEVVVFDLEQPKGRTLRGVKEPVLDELH